VKRAAMIAGVGAGVGAGVSAGVGAARRLLGGTDGSNDAPASRALAVTVFRSVEDVAPGGVLPDGLREVGDAAEIALRVAPGDKGTEVVARFTGEPDDETRRRVRRALRDAKQVAETGEILQPDRPGTTEPTVLNAPLRAATANAREEGRL
jgi:hypothetical protein